MSSPYVRGLCETWAGALSVPFYNTINEEQDPADAVWVTLEFDVFNSQRDTFCGDVIEDGMVRLVFLGAAGGGATSLLTTAQTEAAAFFANVDPTGALVLQNVGAPEEFGSSDTPLFAVVVAVDYSYVH